MPHADTLAALTGGPPPGAMAPPADAPPPRAPSPYQGTLDALNAALQLDPLAGLLAGVAVPAVAEGGVALAKGGAATVGKLAAPVLGGSKLANAAPVLGPALQARREAAVGARLLGQASDPAALRAFVASPPVEPEVRGSPRTLAGAVVDDVASDAVAAEAREIVRRAVGDADDQGAGPAGGPAPWLRGRRERRGTAGLVAGAPWLSTISGRGSRRGGRAKPRFRRGRLRCQSAWRRSGPRSRRWRDRWVN